MSTTPEERFAATCPATGIEGFVAREAQASARRLKLRLAQKMAIQGRPAALIGLERTQLDEAEQLAIKLERARGERYRQTKERNGQYD